MMKWWWLLPLFVVGLVVQAPAQLLPWVLKLVNGADTVQLTQIQGTLWQGSTHVSVPLNTGGQLELQQVQWQLSPWHLLRARAVVHLQVPQRAGNELYGEATVQLGTTELSVTTQLQGQLQPLIQQWRLPVPITVAGQLELRLDDYGLTDFDSQPWCQRLAGQLITRNTEIRINHVWHPLGDFNTQLDCVTDGNQRAVQLRVDPPNSIGLMVAAQVGGTWHAPQVTVEGTLQPTVQTPAPIRELLVFLGQPDAQGRYSFSW